MDRTVPTCAAILLDFIGDIEAPRGYDTIYGNNQNKLPKPVTKMTVAEIQAIQREWSRRFGSSATGRYQFMRATLADLRRELRLRDGQIFDANLQDRLAYHLLKRRGLEAFMNRRIDSIEFGRRLAMEWASLPVLADTKGAHRMIRRGQSYYAGDKLNKSLVAPERVELILRKAKTAEQPAFPAETPPKPAERVSESMKALIIAVLVAAIALAAYAGIDITEYLPSN